MSYRIKEIPISCPNCGFNLHRVFREVYNINKKLVEVDEKDPVCRRCIGNMNWIMLIKGAVKIETLTMGERNESYKGAKSYGEKVEQATERKKKEEEELVIPDELIEAPVDQTHDDSNPLYDGIPERK